MDFLWKNSTVAQRLHDESGRPARYDQTLKVDRPLSRSSLSLREVTLRVPVLAKVFRIFERYPSCLYDNGLSRGVGTPRPLVTKTVGDSRASRCDRSQSIDSHSANEGMVSMEEAGGRRP